MTTGNITGNLTVGGVLTYDDVTNVDSIGIVTARSGKVVGGVGILLVDFITLVYLHLQDNIDLTVRKDWTGDDCYIYHDGNASKT